MRSGNAVEVLIDGAEALPAIVDELRRARSHVHLTGWHFSPDFALARDGELVILRNLLAELAERVDVRVLAWAGAPLPLFRPSRHDVREMRDAPDRVQRSNARSTRRNGRCTATTKRRSSSTTASRLSAGSTSPPSRVTATTPVTIFTCERRLARRLRTNRGSGRRRCCRALPHALARGDGRPRSPRSSAFAAAGRLDVQVVRTIPEHVYNAIPRGDFSILESYMRAIKGAERFIYIENQFLWSPEIEALLHDKITIPLPLTSGFCCCSPRSRAAAPTTRAASSAT